MEKKQSSIDWLVNELKTYEIYKPLSLSKWDVLDELERKAKAIHRKEIVFAHLDGAEGAVETINKYASVSNTLNVIYSIKNGTDSHEDGEEYYNQTYGE